MRNLCTVLPIEHLSWVLVEPVLNLLNTPLGGVRWFLKDILPCSFSWVQTHMSHLFYCWRIHYGWERFLAYRHTREWTVLRIVCPLVFCHSCKDAKSPEPCEWKRKIAARGSRSIQRRVMLQNLEKRSTCFSTFLLVKWVGFPKIFAPKSDKTLLLFRWFFIRSVSATFSLFSARKMENRTGKYCPVKVTFCNELEWSEG